jgi:hypothetical protein
MHFNLEATAVEGRWKGTLSCEGRKIADLEANSSKGIQKIARAFAEEYKRENGAARIESYSDQFEL